MIFLHLFSEASKSRHVFILCKCVKYISDIRVPKKRERNKIKSKEKERKENSSESVDAGRLKSKDRNLK